MVEIKKRSIDCADAKTLIGELNHILTGITGDDGTIHFQQTDVEKERSAFFIGYIDRVPMACGALRELDEECGEIKRVYARKNTCGMGRKIITALEDEAVFFGYRTLLLETRVQNTHAIQFYESNGYIHCENYGVYVGKDNSYCFRKEICCDIMDESIC